VHTPLDLHDGLLGQITHFFEQYKALESGKWVKVENWVGVEEAREEICGSIQRYKRLSQGE
jgi:inorganic pyrophosphatase